ncbi:MAG: TIGR03936 family radical SAM-associated protein [Sedimentisphaerales bacterium]
MLAVIRFKVRGIVRYLSHAEMLRVFQRACVRAGIPVAFSEGFNPHQKMSLVLPRSVGVESDDEILCLGIEENATIDAESLKAGLTSELPEGIEIVSVELGRYKDAPVPQSAKYQIRLREDKKPAEEIEKLLACEMLLVERTSGEGTKAKQVDVRPFIKSIDAATADIMVECAVSPAGTIRVDEILGLLKVGTEDLAGPVKRIKVEWKGLLE